MSSTRFTVRFRTDDDAERRAAEYLKSLKHGEQNRFLVGAVLSALGDNPSASAEVVRRIIREELASALNGVTVPVVMANNKAPDAQEDDLGILDDLELFN